MSRRLIDHIILIHARGVDTGVIYRALTQKIGAESAKRLLKAAGLPLTVSDIMRGRKLSASTREKLREAQTGKKASKETIAKRSVALTGRVVSAETRAKISTAMTGRAVSKKTRKKIAASLRRRKFSLRRWELRIASRRGQLDSDQQDLAAAPASPAVSLFVPAPAAAEMESVEVQRPRVGGAEHYETD